jgi:hypothetical protein
MCIHVYVELLKGLHIYKQWKPIITNIMS